MFTDGSAFDLLTITLDRVDDLDQALDDDELDRLCEAVIANLAQYATAEGDRLSKNGLSIGALRQFDAR